MNATVIGETALEILKRGGITGADAVATFCGILALNYGWFAFNTARDATRTRSTRKRIWLNRSRRLPAERFPLTLSVAGELGGYGSDAHYSSHFGS